ncbi:MAG: hypothetical protein GX070_04925 [Alcaligenaceae bacterium]|nr:hypothetical protein [Alcaligenaceae bacterium]
MLRWKPATLLVLFCVGCFLFWALGTSAGSRWTLRNVIAQVGGELGPVEGTIWSGLKLERLLIDTPEVKVVAANARVKVSWLELFNRRLKVDHMEVGDLSVSLLPVQTVEKPDSEPFTMPGLPVTIEVDTIRIGKFSLKQPDGSNLPVGISGFWLTGLLVNQEQAKGKIDSVHIEHPLVNSDLNGDLHLTRLEAPWPLELNLQAKASSDNRESPICLERFLSPSVFRGQEQGNCAFNFSLQAKGSAERLGIVLDGAGQGIALDANTTLDLFAAMPLKNAHLKLDIDDGSSLLLNAGLKEKQGPDGSDRLEGTLLSNRLALNRLLANAVPESLLTARMGFSADMSGAADISQFTLQGKIDGTSRWNRKPLSGDINLQIAADSAAGDFYIENSHINLVQGENKIQSSGGFGHADSRLLLDINLASLADLWPDLTGNARVDGELNGSLEKHNALLNVAFAQSDEKQIGKAPIKLSSRLDGSLAKNDQNTPVWQARVADLKIQHAGIALEQQDTLDIYLAPEAQGQDKQWSLGATQFELVLDGKRARLDHQGSEGGAHGWNTQGQFSKLTLSQQLMNDIGLVLGAGQENNRGQAKKTADVTYDGNWRFQAGQALSGELNLNRTAGDGILPLAVAIPLDFDRLGLRLQEQQTNEAASLLSITGNGQGEQSSLDMNLNLNMDSPFPLRDGYLKLDLTDKSVLQVQTEVQEKQGVNSADKISTVVKMQDLALDKLLAGAIPQALLTSDIRLETDLLDQAEIKNIVLSAKFNKGSQWNRQPLEGHLQSRINMDGLFSSPAVAVAADEAPARVHYDRLVLSDTDIYLTLGNNRIAGSGGFGEDHSRLSLNVNAPSLASFWPGLPGSVNFNGVLDGKLANHSLTLLGMYADQADDRLGSAPIKLETGLAGRWAETETGSSWAATLKELDIQHAGIGLTQTSPLSFSLLPSALGGLEWTASASALTLALPGNHIVSITQEGAQGSDNKWQTKGAIKNLVLSPSLINQVRVLLDPSLKDSLAKTGVAGNNAKEKQSQDVVLDADWGLEYNNILLGNFNIKRTDGVGVLPFNTPVPLDFDSLALNITQQQDSTGQADIVNLKISGSGENSSLNADINADMLSAYYLRDGNIALSLPDGSSMHTQMQLNAVPENRSYRIDGFLETQKLELGKLLAGIIPPALLSSRLDVSAELSPDSGLVSANVKGGFDKGSNWNKQALNGTIDVAVQRSLGSAQSVSSAAPDPKVYLIPKADINLVLGTSTIKSSGAFGQAGDKLALAIKAPRFADFWPGLPGSLVLDGNMDGSLENHVIGLKGSFAQGKSKELGQAPVDFDFGLKGFWGEVSPGLDGWKGTLDRFNVRHAGFSASQDKPLDASIIPVGAGGLPEWQLGASVLSIGLPGKHVVTVNQQGASGSDGNWASKGAINRLVISPALVNDMQTLLNLVPEKDGANNGGIIDNRKKKPGNESLVFDLDWDFLFNGALAGGANLKRVAGDFIVPLQSPFALGLNNLGLVLKASPVSATQSVVQADLAIATANKGSLTARLDSRMNGLVPDLNGGTKVAIKGRLDDIAWLSAFAGELLDLGGSINIDMTAQSSPSGQWTTNGSVTGDKVKIVQIDNGVRLLDGTLRGTFRNNEFVINSLRFPSVIRVMPSEWRTKQWIEENPPAQNGSMDITGRWNLMNGKGNARILLDHYPIVQRSDRFAMMSGSVDIDASLPRIDINGKVTADAGWASIDILGTVPTVDGDVIVLKPGQKEVAPTSSNLDLNLDFTVDLGPRFYLVGMGLNSGLVGSLNIIQKDLRLTAMGAFRTRGGAIEAYGQRLQIRRGHITFQGNIANPVLDIEAIRTGVEVEAGLRVIGTAQKPKITLVSYPDVSEVEKLSWLIMGRGPDSNGGDIALLFSVGSSILGGGEPFYRQIGIDDIAVRTGNVGKSGSVLPEQTVASGLEREDDLETQFFVASKKFGNGVTVSVEQALAGTGTVVRTSYKLMRYLTVDAKIGTINGLELVYRRFFRD